MKRLQIAIDKLHAMKPSSTRDDLVRECERVIGNIHKAASLESMGAKAKHC